MSKKKKFSTRLMILTVIGAFALLSAGCEIEPYHYGYHHDEGYHGYHHHDGRKHNDDHDFR